MFCYDSQPWSIYRIAGTQVQFVVAPKVSGWLRKLMVSVGDQVTHNQLIAILDDAEYTQQVEQDRAELEVAKANAANYAGDLAIADYLKSLVSLYQLEGSLLSRRGIVAPGAEPVVCKEEDKKAGP